MDTPEVSKQALGMGYVVSAGVVLSLTLLVHAVMALRDGPSALLVVLLGLVPALSLVAANYWLPRSGLEGTQVWTVAEWSGLGVGLLTLVNLAVLTTDVSAAASRTGLLASNVAVGGFVGVLIGTLLELRRTTTRLSQGNDVLNRVLRHDLRNNINVVLGHLSELERSAEGEPATRVDSLQQSVDELITTTEKARKIDGALRAAQRDKEPIDLVPAIETRVEALRRAHPDATVTTDLPDTAPVRADWMLGSVLGNVIENTVVHSEDTPSLGVVVEVDGTRTLLRVSDDCPTIPDAELDVFSTRAETPLRHSKGVGLWLVIWLVESYGGKVSFGTSEAGGNVVSIEFRTATWLSSHPLSSLLT